MRFVVGKSTIQSMELTIAGASHNCRFNKSHRITRGSKRLTIKDDGDKNYCLNCARKFISADIEKMKLLLSSVESAILENVES